MAIDTRKLEIDLARIFRSHGVRTSDFYGVGYVGICTTDVDYADHRPVRVVVPSMPNGRALSLADLARDIAEVLR